MRYFIDEKTGWEVCEPDCCDEWPDWIWMLGVDYDGFCTVDGLKGLVDELVEMASKARECLHNGQLFPKGESE